MSNIPDVESRFFDVHFHALNLSHLNFSAYLHNLRPSRQIRSRMKAGYLLKMISYAFRRFILGSKKGSKLGNLVSLMENDTGVFFLLMEQYLKIKSPRVLLPDNTLLMGDRAYQQIVLTPLMIDFYYPSTFNNIFYHIPPRKPLEEQAIDLLNGIRSYYQNKLDADLQPVATGQDHKLFAIHPFLGINTRNYADTKQLNDMLDRYFAKYQENKTAANESLENQEIFFSGIKVYPPLGFNPWPDAPHERSELTKVEHLYDYCISKGIPITTHCQEMGIDIDARARELVNPIRWEKVLDQPRYHGLKLNLAHFGQQDYWFFPKRKWEKRIIKLINDHPNVYTDIAFRGFTMNYYRDLAELIYKHPRLGERVLFGSDFLISLIEQKSYNHYLAVAAQSYKKIDPDLMHRICSINPQQFIFG